MAHCLHIASGRLFYKTLTKLCMFFLSDDNWFSIYILVIKRYVNFYFVPASYYRCLSFCNINLSLCKIRSCLLVGYQSVTFLKSCGSPIPPSLPAPFHPITTVVFVHPMLCVVRSYTHGRYLIRVISKMLSAITYYYRQILVA